MNDPTLKVEPKGEANSTMKDASKILSDTKSNRSNTSSDTMEEQITLSPEDVKGILQGQEEIKAQLESNNKLIETFNSSLSRIFRLYQDLDKDVDDLKKWKGEKKITNGNTEKTIKELKGKDGDLETKVDSIQYDVNSMKTDIAVIKATVIKDEKKDDRFWTTKNLIITGVVIGLVLFGVDLLCKVILHT
ncbi:MAG: hypothetical protein A4E27_00548 [Methanobacterium sp. PtaU1.Bin242]|nr:MAG: hypothetical protein A4E27_00548 [Methanobacterium sp. PtaU1.Bin242]